MVLTKRSIPVVIILSLVTCGIYYYVWMYQTSNEVNLTLGDTTSNPAMEIVLTIITCGIYGFYWLYKYSQKIGAVAVSRNMQPSDNGLLYIILAIFGLVIVAQGIMQSTLNAIIDGKS